MTNIDTIFARALLKEVLVDVKKHLKDQGISSARFMKNAWGYKYSDGTVEFHINKNEDLPLGYFWHGRGRSITEAKASGWSAWLDKEIIAGTCIR